MQDTQITHQTKEMTYLLFFTAIALSIVSAYYSIAGLAAIFAAAVIPIVVMGSVLEFAKLVVASWLYRSWNYVPFLMRTYFSISLVILMSLTSMGIFGFLSKAHLDQAVPTGDVAAKVAIIDEKIRTEKDNIDASRQQLKQLDSQVDQIIGRSDNAQGVERSLQIRRGQQKERATLLAEIGSAQTRVARLNEERSPIAAELRKVEAEVGPIKYIAALIYGDNPDNNILEKAVRVVIIMIVIVFDPLAVLLLMAASMPIKKKEENESPTNEETSNEESSITEQFQAKANIIKERFFSKFKATKEPVLEQRSSESTTDTVINSVGDNDSGSSSEHVSTEDRSPGVAVTTKDDIYPETKEPDWTITEPPTSKTVDYDSAGRRMTPVIKTIEQDVLDLQNPKSN
jgi:hypothetical protein